MKVTFFDSGGDTCKGCNNSTQTVLILFIDGDSIHLVKALCRSCAIQNTAPPPEYPKEMLDAYMASLNRAFDEYFTAAASLASGGQPEESTNVQQSSTTPEDETV